MNSRLTIKLSVTELCECVPVSEEMLQDIVNEGILEPQGASMQDWVFDARMLDVIKKAIQLKRELEIEWAGIALALDLLNEMDQLKSENRQLRRRLSRFIRD